MKRTSKKGFTLMEMLIVIAIIAILIAIAIPVFTAQLDKAKIRTDQSNARSLKSMVATNYMSDTLPSGATDGKYYLSSDGNRVLVNTTGAMACEFTGTDSRYDASGYIYAVWDETNYCVSSTNPALEAEAT